MGIWQLGVFLLTGKHNLRHLLKVDPAIHQELCFFFFPSLFCENLKLLTDLFWTDFLLFISLKQRWWQKCLLKQVWWDLFHVTPGRLDWTAKWWMEPKNFTRYSCSLNTEIRNLSLFQMFSSSISLSSGTSSFQDHQSTIQATLTTQCIKVMKFTICCIEYL